MAVLNPHSFGPAHAGSCRREHTVTHHMRDIAVAERNFCGWQGECRVAHAWCSMVVESQAHTRTARWSTSSGLANSSDGHRTIRTHIRTGTAYPCAGTRDASPSKMRTCYRVKLSLTREAEPVGPPAAALLDRWHPGHEAPWFSWYVPSGRNEKWWPTPRLLDLPPTEGQQQQLAPMHQPARTACRYW